MKIGIYNPYLDSLGGGERYTLTLASHWSKTHEVDIFWNEGSILSQAQIRFDLDLSSVCVVPNIFLSRNLIQKLSVTRRYDCIFFLSDGSVPTSFAKRNILHFQVPFSSVAVPMWKAKEYQAIVCNSEFTKNHLDSTVTIPRSVIYPPVAIEKMKAGSKTKTILSVGRFSSLYGAKKQNILIEAFRKASTGKQMTGWKLVFAGGLLPADKKYLESLRVLADGLPIEFYPNCSFSELVSLYGAATIYWHAAGYGESSPANMEHFGITTVEAMGSGCVPIVYRGGGQTEIVLEGESGMLWQTIDELVQKTLSVVGEEKTKARLKSGALARAKNFSTDRFAHSFDQLLSEL